MPLGTVVRVRCGETVREKIGGEEREGRRGVVDALKWFWLRCRGELQRLE